MNTIQEATLNQLESDMREKAFLDEVLNLTVRRETFTVVDDSVIEVIKGDLVYIGTINDDFEIEYQVC